MPNIIGLAGGQPQKPTRWEPIYTGRWSSGIWTNRSPLRDAVTTRIVEKFYGAAGDALIDGSNVEISNKLTLVRRPGTSVADSNSYTSPDRFYDFRLSSPALEQIDVMVDQANALYSLYNGTKSLVFTKSTNSDQSYMQSVGNTLYFADGIDNKKWLQSLVTWSANEAWGANGSEFFTTFLIDPNNNIQQLIGTSLVVTGITIVNNVLTVTTSTTLTNLLSDDDIVTFPATMTATFLEKQSVTITGVTTNTFTAAFTNANYSGSESSIRAAAINGGTPISGGTVPTWGTTVPSSSNNFQGSITYDGSAIWVNRGQTVENWGIAPPTTVLTPTLGKAFASNWIAMTSYSLAGAIIDSNGNLQQVSTAGTSGSATPTWNTTPFGTTTDNTVTWTLIQTAAQLVWQPSYNYVSPLSLTQCAAASGGTTVYTGLILGGASNALAGNTYLVTGFAELANNGIFTCSASTTTTLTLSNTGGLAEDATSTATASKQGTIQYVIGNAAGVNCLFKLTPVSQPTISGNVSAYLYPASHIIGVGSVQLQYPTTTGSAAASYTTLNSLSAYGDPPGFFNQTILWNIVNGAGSIVGTVNPFPSYMGDVNLAVLGNLSFPVAGNYTITIVHQDGIVWGMGGGATLVSGPNNNQSGQTATVINGYPLFGGNNQSGPFTDTFVINIPTPGTYPFEFDYAYWYHPGQIFTVTCNGNTLANGATESGTVQPSWPGFSTSYAPAYANVSEAAGSLLWSNIGPVSDFVWSKSVGYTLPNTMIVDTNGYTEAPFRSGVSGTTQPIWLTGEYNLTNDNPNLIWINEGGGSSLPSGSLSTFNGGWQYCIALVNTLDNTVSNCTPLSVATGNFVGVESVTIAAGQGLPAPSNIDPQSDYVAIFRTTDGQAIPFLIPGVSTTYTLTLHDYLLNGYSDTTPDTGLNNLIQGAILGENTPPATGSKNLTYHLGRIFYSVANTVKWTTGAEAPVGNGINGSAPLNYDTVPSLVKRLVPVSSGLLVFTVSDVYLIQGLGTSSNPIQNAVPVLPGIGLASYNALDTNGPIIGMFTTDNEFLILDPSQGEDDGGFPIGDRLRLNNGNPGQTWNPANVYVAWHVQGEDKAWYVCDGEFGWYKLMPTPSPESGYTWCPFASITNGAKAVQSIELTPGKHRLLIGPTGTGELLQRDLSAFSDVGTPYPAWAVIGSAVLAQPGQVAEVAFINTECTKVGTPVTLGILIDEALPYYTGPIDILKQWVNDPPNTKVRPSRSFWAQRFYLAQNQEDAAAMRHCQIIVYFSPTDTVQNEMHTLTVFGAYSQEM